MDLEKKDEQPLRSTAAPVSISDDLSRKRKRRTCIICCSSVTGVIFIVFLVLLILGLTVFKAKKPVLTVDSVAVQDLNTSFTLIPIQIHLNLSLALGLSIKNPNKVSAKYGKSTATLLYRGREIGDVPVPAGKLGSDDTTKLNLTLTVFADRLVSDSELAGDLSRGTLPLSTYARIKAKVRVSFVNIHVTSTSTCDLSVDISSRSVQNQTCNYQNKI